MYEVEPIIYRRGDKAELDFVETTDPVCLTHAIYEAGKPEHTPAMSIGILGYKHLEQTMWCVESVMRFVGDIDYELILMDNGSEDDDETVKYFQSVLTTRKKIIQVEKPLGNHYGAIFGTQLMYKYASGDVFVFLGNDNIITENALQNMLTCLWSSPNIGIVTPMSSSVHLLQDPGITFQSYDDVFAAGREFNVSDPRKWQERLHLSTVATAVKREALEKVGFFDWSAENGLCLRIRQAGYKAILLGDTWVCHNHDYKLKTDTHAIAGESEEAEKKRNVHQEIIFNLYGKMDLFGEIMVFERQLVEMLGENLADVLPRLLAIEVSCGQGLLDLKNQLRLSGIFESKSVAFTTNPKYYSMLTSVADKVFCDRMEYMSEHLAGEQFDYILMAKPINLCQDPKQQLQKLLALLAPGGQLLLKIRNTANVLALLKILGKSVCQAPDMPRAMGVEEVESWAKSMGITEIKMGIMPSNTDQAVADAMEKILINSNGVKDINGTLGKLLAHEYFLCLRAPDGSEQLS